MSTTVWIIVAVVVVLVVVALAVVVARKGKERKRLEANEIREKAADEAALVEERELLARESEAKARRAQAEADVKAAEADKLAQQAHSHQGVAAQSRDDLDAEFARANELDPDVDHRSGAKAAHTDNNGRLDDHGQAHHSGADINETYPGQHDAGARNTAAHDAAAHTSTDPRSTGEKVRDTIDPRTDNGHHRTN